MGLVMLARLTINATLIIVLVIFVVVLVSMVIAQLLNPLVQTLLFATPIFIAKKMVSQFTITLVHPFSLLKLLVRLFLLELHAWLVNGAQMKNAQKSELLLLREIAPLQMSSPRAALIPICAQAVSPPMKLLDSV